MAEFVRVKEAFSYGNHDVAVGEIWSTDRPEYTKGREVFFEPIEAAASRATGVETATAAPNEVRELSTTRGRIGRRKAVKEEAEPPVVAAEDVPSPQEDSE